MANSEPLENLCNKLLAEGRALLKLETGIVSHIKDNEYHVVAISSNTDAFQVGEVFPLESTYCRDVYAKAVTLALTEIDGVPGLQLHPLYDVLPLETYISTPILVEGEIWGTLNFSGMRRREAPFNDQDVEWIIASARRISRHLINDHKTT